MLICLKTGIAQMGDMKETAVLLTTIMSAMFITIGTGSMIAITKIKEVFISVGIIIVVPIVTAMIVTGK